MNKKVLIKDNKMYIIYIIAIFLIEVVFFLMFLRGHSNFVEQLVLWIFIIFHILWGIFAGFLNNKDTKHYLDYKFFRVIGSPQAILSIFFLSSFLLFTWINISDPASDKLGIYGFFATLGISILLSMLWIGGFFLLGYTVAKFVIFLNFIKNK